MSAKLDFDKICRTCLGEKNLQQLFRRCCCTKEEECISEMLNLCTLIQFTRNDGLPSQICQDCVTEIQNAFKFAQKCEKSNEVLLACLEAQKTRKQTENKRKTNKNNQDVKVEVEYLEKSENDEDMDTKHQIIILKSDIADPNQDSLDANQLTLDTNQDDSNLVSVDTNQDFKIDQFSVDSNLVSMDTNHPMNQFTPIGVETNQIIIDTNQPEGTELILDSNRVKNENSNDDQFILDANQSTVGANRLETSIIFLDAEPESEVFPKSEEENEFVIMDANQTVSEDQKHFSLDTNLSLDANHELYIASEDPNQTMDSNQSDYEIDESIPQPRKIFRSKGPPYECKKCFVTYDTYKELSVHHKTVKHPKNGKRPCHICKKLIAYTHFSTHVKSHKQERPFSCDICDARFTLKPNLHRHMSSRHSDDRPFRCEICSKGFTRLEILKNHTLTHTGGTALLCNFCGKTYASVTSFRSHLSFHAKQGDTKEKLPELTHTCEVCEKVFASKTLLKVHQVIHGEKKFLCSVCGKGFFKKMQLVTHSRVHTGIRPYSCEICGKKFGHSASLKNHKLIHSGVKPYTCKICERSFKQQGHLESHTRTHSGVKPYSCNFCGKSFAISGNLTVHMRIHTGVLPYACNVCEKAFNNSSSLKKHTRTHEEKNEIAIENK